VAIFVTALEGQHLQVAAEWTWTYLWEESRQTKDKRRWKAG